MKKMPVVLTLTFSIMLTALAAAAPASAAQGPLTGRWYSVDAADGSDQVLTIRSSGARTYSVFLFDEAANVCGGAPAKVVGTGRLQDGVLQTIGTLTCKPGGNILRFRIGIAYEYDAVAQQLLDDFDTVWTR